MSRVKKDIETTNDLLFSGARIVVGTGATSEPEDITLASVRAKREELTKKEFVSIYPNTSTPGDKTAPHLLIIPGKSYWVENGLPKKVIELGGAMFLVIGTARESEITSTL